MKLLIKSFLILLIFVSAIYAETPLIYGIELNYDRFYDKSMLLGGAHIGFFNEPFFFGASGFTNIYSFEFGNDNSHRLENTIYGGLNIRFIPKSSSLFRFSAGLIIGGGIFDFEEDKYTRPPEIKEDLFFALEPDINLMLNLSLYIRLGYQISYRSTISPDLELYETPKISGFSTSLFAQFGRL